MRLILVVVTVSLCILSFLVNSAECISKIGNGYELVKGSVYPFKVGNKKACFFAFYTLNPYPLVSAGGDGNNGEAIWYGYYFKNNHIKVYEFPKPVDGIWNNVCTVNAISFIPMYEDNRPDVTVIGSCARNFHNNSYAFVFNRRNNKYVLDNQLFVDLSETYALTITDIQKYIKDPGYIVKLRSRY